MQRLVEGVIDESQPVQISAAFSIAAITKINILNSATGVQYAVYPDGEQAYGTPGANIGVNIWVQNVGDAGDVFIRIVETSTGTILDELVLTLNAGELDTTIVLAFVMPATDYGIMVEVGH